MRTLVLDGVPLVKPTCDGDQTHGGIAVLLPYADKVERGRYSIDGRDFQLPIEIDGHASHGFAKDSAWRFEKKGRSFVSLSALLKSDGYPGLLETRIVYAVTQSVFSTECTVVNVSDANCPITVGFHPYFLANRWKVAGGSKAYKYELRDLYFPTGKRRPYSLEYAGPKVEHDDTFAVKDPIEFQTEKYRIVLKRKAMPYLIIYNGTFAEGRSVALEPYTGITNAYNNGIGNRILKPRQTLRCGYDIILSD